MGQNIQVVTDSSGDLPPELLEHLGIEVVPLIVLFGTEAYVDGELTMEAFWEKAAGTCLPQTSQPPVGAFEECFERLAAQGKQVLCLTITGKHSGTFNAACLAARHFPGAVEVFDSLSLSLGLGLQAVAAAEAAEAGRSMHEILVLLEDMRARMRLTILLNTLENLRHGGRASAFMAVLDRMTRMLNIKPVINMVEGQLRLLSAARSSRRGLRRMSSLIEELGPLERLAVVHARAPELAEEMADRLAERTGFSRERIWMEETGAVLASHAGAGVVGVMALPAR